MIRNIHIDATVTPDCVLTGKVPPDVPPGPHRVMVRFEETASKGYPGRKLVLPSFDVGKIIQDLKLRRETI